MNVRITIKNGVVTNGRDLMAEMYRSLPDGEYIVPSPFSLAEPHTVEEWRKTYFHMRDLLHEATDTGYTKNELHTVVKGRIIKGMVEDELEGQGWFTVDLPKYSTQYLTALGWKEYVKRFKEFAVDTFEIYI